jgi:N,N'-diacetyllegionaminate synthase
MTFIIAEAGLSFDGSLDKALKLVDAAKEAGADAVKFQTFLPSFDPTLARFTLNTEQWQTVFGHALESKIIFMSTPFDRWAFDLLRDFGIKHWKIPSGELTNDAYLRAIPEQAQFYYLSTGMASETEISHALSVLPDPLSKEVSVLYCVSGYPVPDEELNLEVIAEWNFAKYPAYTIGFSDHTKQWVASRLALAMGAQIIEKHFMLSYEDTVPDEKVNLDAKELAFFVKDIRHTEKMLGTGWKKVMPCERKLLDKRNRFHDLH